MIEKSSFFLLQTIVRVPSIGVENTHARTHARADTGRCKYMVGPSPRKAISIVSSQPPVKALLPIFHVECPAVTIVTVSRERIPLSLPTAHSYYRGLGNPMPNGTTCFALVKIVCCCWKLLVVVPSSPIRNIPFHWDDYPIILSDHYTIRPDTIKQLMPSFHLNVGGQ